MVKEEEDGIMRKIIENIRKFTGSKIVRRVCRYTGDVIIGVLIVLVVVSVIGSIQSKGKDWNVPGLGKYKWLTVLSGSMKPTFNPGDLIIDEKVNPNTLKVGDTVTYIFGDRFLATHRIVKINKDNKGTITFKTKGDSNNAMDDLNVSANAIVGKYLFRIPLVGFALQKLKGLTGVILMWVLFFYVLGTEIYRMAKESKKERNEKTVVQ